MGEKLPAVPAMTEIQARAVTNKIRTGVEGLWRLLAEARAGEAWAVLGYASWNAYVTAEFGMSHANANRLAAQGEVVAAIEAAAPQGARARATPPVSARQATAIRSTPGALKKITKAVAAGAEPAAAVKKAIGPAVPRSTHVAEHRRDEQEHLQDRLRSDVDALVAKIGRALTADLLRSHVKRLAIPDKTPIVTQSAAMPGCDHPKQSVRIGNGGIKTCGKCGKISGRNDVWRQP